MSLSKIHHRAKSKTASIRYRDFLFVLFCLALLSSLLVYKSVSANTFTIKNAFVQQLGHESRQQHADFALAKAAFDKQEYSFSYRSLKVLAEQGHSQAQYFLATQYDAGLGVNKDEFMAFRWYKKAARAGIRAAQHNLAVAYAKGNGIKADLSKAISWWKSAAMQGHIDSQFNLGIVYATGRESVEPNLKKALKWWRMAAINGDAAAQFNLGALYANGIGMSSRTCEASRWWKESAKNGFAQAEMALAVLQTKKDYDVCR